MTPTKNIVWHEVCITRKLRNQLNDHRSVLVWLTGLSGSGKSTLAHAVEKEFYKQGIRTYVLDGDNVRHGLNSNLGFSKVDRAENIRRIAETAKLLMDAGIVVFASFISPYKKDRDNIRNIIPESEIVEIYCNTPVEICELRDVKGLYKKAREGAIKGYTGIDSIYQEPIKPDLELGTHKLNIEESINKIIMKIEEKCDLWIEEN